MQLYSPSPAQRFNYQMLRHHLGDESTAQLLYELDQIPTGQLISDNIITELTSDGALDRGVSQFIAERPYQLVLRDSSHRYLAESLLFYLANRDQGQNLPAFHPDHPDHHIATRFLFTPATWQDAMIYIRYHDGRLTNISPNEISNGADTLLNYRVRYITRHFTDKSIIAALGMLFDLNQLDQNVNKLYELLSLATCEKDLEHKFLNQKLQKVTELNFSKFDDMFEYPVWFEFSDEVTEQIIQRILDDKLQDYQIDYYLGVEEHHHDYAKIYPAIKHIITNTYDQHLLWTAGDVLNLIWKAIPDDEQLQAWFRREVYQMYWPKIGSVWPIQHYDEFKFENKNKQKIFDDALSWVLCLKDIDQINRPLGAYLRKLARDCEDITRLPDPVMKRVFDIRHRRKSSARFYQAAFTEFGEDEAIRCTSYPDNLEEAKITLDHIVAGDLDSDNYMFALEQLVLTGNWPKVGAYIINRYADELPRIADQIEMLNESEIYNREWIISIFTAATGAATELDEIPALEHFAAAIKALPIHRTEKSKAHELIDTHLEIARQNVADFQREQKALVKAFTPLMSAAASHQKS